MSKLDAICDAAEKLATTAKSLHQGKATERRYDPVAVNKMIERDKRIGAGEAKKIHALLKGWRGDAITDEEWGGFSDAAKAIVRDCTR